MPTSIIKHRQRHAPIVINLNFSSSVVICDNYSHFSNLYNPCYGVGADRPIGQTLIFASFFGYGGYMAEMKSGNMKVLGIENM